MAMTVPVKHPKNSSLLAEAVSDSQLHTHADLVAAGVSAPTIQRAVLRGTLTQCARGIYLSPHADLHAHLGFAVISMTSPGIICMGSAAVFHELGEEDPPELWYAVDRRRIRATQFKGLDSPHRLLSWTGLALEVGVEHHTILGADVQITSRARTVVDLLRHRNLVGDEPGMSALRDFLTGGGLVNELSKIADRLGCGEELAPYLETSRELQQSLRMRPTP